ncbi:MAG: prenyltransferase [Bacteroidales bacterium]|nr:prenyltransferase [Bacteroidales bacterium]MBN2750695.1 prenyltransferase [Bacteroidales bacterium]
MSTNNNLKVWLAQMRAPFLILAVLLVGIGVSLAYKYLPANESISITHIVLLMIGAIASHISVNLFNEYSDYSTKIDFSTQRTPFSGGSGMLVSGFTKPNQVLAVAIATLLISAAVGLYFAIVSHIMILVFALVGGITIVAYTRVLTRFALGELLSGLTLGSLMVIGSYIALTAAPSMPFTQVIPTEVWWMSIPAGILTSLLLLINELPDLEADTAGGRRHIVVLFGRKVAAWVYAAGMALTFGSIIAMPLLGITTFWVYIALLPVPLAIKASVTAVQKGDDLKHMIPALGSNVVVVLATDFLLALSVII